MKLEPPIERGKYRLTEVLRRAAAVTTYGGVERESGAPVVLKELRFAQGGEWKEHDLFAREVDVLAAVRHPGVPRVLDHFEAPGDDGARVCLVMERVPGESLDARLGRGAPLETAEVRRVLEGVLEILAHLHGLAPPILHRDVKPANILLSPERVYLVDFGGVRRFMPWAKGGSTVIGTFGYMAPEQLHGEATPRSDLFGLGATAAALLAGCEAPDLPRKGLRIDVAALPAAREPLRSIVSRMVEPEPEARYGSAEEVLAALRAGDRGILAVRAIQQSALEPTQRRSALRWTTKSVRAMLRLDWHGDPEVDPETELVVDAMSGGPRDRLPTHPAARAHWSLRKRISRWLLGGAVGIGLLSAVFAGTRASGGSIWWSKTGQGLTGIALCLFVGSRLVRTRERMVRSLLKLAKHRRGRLVIGEVAVRLRLPPEVARDLLEHLVELDLARRDPEREGGYLILAT